MKTQTRHIYEFLLAAFIVKETQEATDRQVSQLAVETKGLDLNTTVLQWAMYQFGGIARIVNMHDQVQKH